MKTYNWEGVNPDGYFLDKLEPIPFFFFNDTATTEIYTLSLHDALPISEPAASRARRGSGPSRRRGGAAGWRSGRTQPRRPGEACWVASAASLRPLPRTASPSVLILENNSPIRPKKTAPARAVVFKLIVEWSCMRSV